MNAFELAATAIVTGYKTSAAFNAELLYLAIYL